MAHCQAGEPEEAGRIGIQAVEAAGDLDLARARDYLRDLSNRLAKHVGLPVVADFMSKVRPTLKTASS